jgi:hypothetical protein
VEEGGGGGGEREEEGELLTAKVCFIVSESSMDTCIFHYLAVIIE